MLAVLLLSSFPAVAGAIAVRPQTPAVAAPESVASGAHFRVTVHFENDKLAAEALAAAEAAWPWTVAIFGEPVIDAAKPLEVHLYRTAAEYEAVEEPLTHGLFKRNLSFTSNATGAAHIALQPDMSDPVLARVGLPILTRALVAHEASHVIAGRAVPNYGTWPTWLTEGAAMWISEQTMKKEAWIESAMDDPMLSTSAARVKQLDAAKKLPSLGTVFDDLLGELDNPERYAVWLHLFRFLHDGKQSAALARIITTAKQTGGGSELAAAVGKAARAELTPGGGLAARDREFTTYVRALAPRWDEVLRSLSTRGDAWTQVAFSSSNAISWRTDAVGSDRYEITGEVEIFDGPSKQLNFMLARTPNGFVEVALTAGYGVDVFEYDNRRLEAAQWKNLATSKVAGVVAGTPIAFRVRVSKSKVTVEIAGKHACDADVGDHSMQGAWGLGAQARSAGAWRKVQLKKG